MLAGTSDFEFGETRIRSALLLEQRYRAQLVWRNGLLFDSSLLVPQRGTRDIATIYLVHDGCAAVGGSAHDVPVGFAIAAREYERYEAGESSIRTWGDPSVTLDVQLDAQNVRAPIGLANGPLPITNKTWDAFSAFAEAMAVGDPLEDKMLGVIAGLAADGVVVADLAAPAPAPPPSLQRLWEALRPFYGRWDLSLEMAELGLQAAMSSRQISRDVKTLNDWLGVDGASFREYVHILRIRTAVLLLSARGATIGEVAARVGYGSVDAIGRAFRDADLPAPNLVRDRVLSPG